MDTAFRVSVLESTHTAEARRMALELASKLDFDDTEAGNIGLVVTEAATNLLKHANGGDLLLRAVQQNGTAGVEMLAVDKGPGIENVARSFQDGYSTAGSQGTGLGAIARLSSIHDIYSQPSQGTAILACVSRRSMRQREFVKRPQFQVGAVSVPKAGEEVCGDQWSVIEHSGRALAIVADGLGHGLLAADAARAAVRIAEEHPQEPLPRLLDRIHGGLRPTRGAAVALAEVEPERGLVRYAGIGNICGSVTAENGVVQHMVSHPGTAGHEVSRITEFTYKWSPTSRLILHSDGLGTQWSLKRYPGIFQRHPSIIAGILYRDFTRQRDDVTVVVLQQGGEAD